MTGKSGQEITKNANVDSDDVLTAQDGRRNMSLKLKRAYSSNVYMQQEEKIQENSQENMAMVRDERTRSASRRKYECFAAATDDCDGDEHDDNYYMEKIQELVNEKLAFFADADKLPRSNNDQVAIVSNWVTDQLKEFITHQMNGSELMLVIQKILYESDLKKNQNRLNMPIRQLQTSDFLTADEKQDLDNGKEIEVPLLGPTLQESGEPMVLKMWHQKTTINYVFKKNWNEYVKKYEEYLKESVKIQVWSYRREGRLCFAIACVDRQEGDNENVVESASSSHSSGVEHLYADNDNVGGLAA